MVGARLFRSFEKTVRENRTEHMSEVGHFGVCRSVRSKTQRQNITWLLKYASFSIINKLLIMIFDPCSKRHGRMLSNFEPETPSFRIYWERVGTCDPIVMVLKRFQMILLQYSVIFRPTNRRPEGKEHSAFGVSEKFMSHIKPAPHMPYLAHYCSHKQQMSSFMDIEEHEQAEQGCVAVYILD